VPLRVFIDGEPPGDAHGLDVERVHLRLATPAGAFRFALGWSTGEGLQARDEFGHDFRSWLCLFGERNALTGPQR
jgi:hypothetical protein